MQKWRIVTITLIFYSAAEGLVLNMEYFLHELVNILILYCN